MKEDKHTIIEESDNESRLPQLEQELAEARESALRRTAELENMRRRHQQERATFVVEANKRLIGDLLTTVDDLERTLSFVNPEEKNPFVQGVELLYKNLLRVLEQYGLEPIESVGTHFDVSLHDALMEEAREDVEPGTITQEVTKGYKLHDTVLRHAKVIVAKSPEPAGGRND